LLQERLAEGDDEPEQGFELDGGGYRAVDPRALDPITDCAPVLDQRFEGRQIFDRYLPRSVGSPETERRPLPAGPVAIAAEVVREWAPYFPILRRVSS
jgi:hypothetical protein